MLTMWAAISPVMASRGSSRVSGNSQVARSSMCSQRGDSHLIHLSTLKKLLSLPISKTTSNLKRKQKWSHRQKQRPPSLQQTNQKTNLTQTSLRQNSHPPKGPQMTNLQQTPNHPYGPTLNYSMKTEPMRAQQDKGHSIREHKKRCVQAR